MKAGHADDLLLAKACLEGDRESLIELDKLIESVAPAIASRGASRQEVEDMLQLTRERLLVASEDKDPRLSLYSGTGRLGGFVRTVAMRLWLNSKRGQREVATAPKALHVLAGSSDPALENLKERYLDQFRTALSDAWTVLSVDERDLIRHQVVDGLSIDELAKLFGVHRSTAARRLLGAKDALVVATRESMRDRLGVSETEVNSIIRLIETRLEQAANIFDSNR